MFSAHDLAGSLKGSCRNGPGCAVLETKLFDFLLSDVPLPICQRNSDSCGRSWERNLFRAFFWIFLPSSDSRRSGAFATSKSFFSQAFPRIGPSLGQFLTPSFPELPSHFCREGIFRQKTGLGVSRLLPRLT